MISEPPPEDREVLSPELVLVSSPEDARRAREQFAERPGAVPSSPAAPVHAEPIEVIGSPSTPPVSVASAPAASIDRSPPPAYPRIALEDLPPEPPRRPRRGRIALAVTLLAAIAVGGYVTATRWHGSRTTNDAAVRSAPSTLASAKRILGVQPLPTLGRQKTLPKPTAHPPAARTQPAKPSTGVADGQKPQPAAPFIPAGASAAFVPARTWAWTQQGSADAYEVTIFLQGRVVLRARPAKPRLVMPSSFRFHAGRYRWTVRSLPATATGKPIVDSTFVLTPATAAAANGS
jgi:hypothetical protein